MNNTLKVKLDNGAFVPVRAHEDDAGLDLISPVDTNIWTNGREAICTEGLDRGAMGRLKGRK